MIKMIESPSSKCCGEKSGRDRMEGYCGCFPLDGWERSH